MPDFARCTKLHPGPGSTGLATGMSEVRGFTLDAASLSSYRRIATLAR
ncbi:hypothetical protein K3728_16400 [Rhodobacteraceae bacterium M385]|nr:hypothetical protein K3728_16400 [Rhodobacteraceae bacterium M385]